MSKLVKRLESGSHSATVHGPNHDHEFRVRFFHDGEHFEESDYFTDDKADAISTARYELDRMAQTDACMVAA